ncbi:MAG: hypothetical protein H6708_18710 [Kofleriaceae bacterium]|nr:hypothetical protein [Kofleriaceae bacterium]
MKLQCERCREIVVADFAVVDGGIEVHCGACDERFVVAPTRPAADAADAADASSPSPAAAEAAPAAPSPTAATPSPAADAGPRMTCPKCDLTQPEAPACRACGLAADKMAAFARAQAPVGDDLQQAWRDAEARWQDDAAHDRFVEAVAAAGAYPWAARRYREVLRHRPDDDQAARQLARIAKMTEVTLLATAATDPRRRAKPYRGTLAMVAALVVVIVIGLVYAVVARRAREAATRPPPLPGSTRPPPPRPTPPPTSRPTPPAGAPGTAGR